MGMMQALEGLLGGPQQRKDYEDFVNRYNSGPPSEGYTDDEVADRYGQIAPRLPPQDYQRAAQAAFERMSPQERAEFGRYVEQRARQRDPSMGDLFGRGPQQYEDPGALARGTTRVQQEQPDLLGGLLGKGGMLSSPIAKAALAGIAAVAAKRYLGGARSGGLL